jgi:hypothetical protein
LCGFFVATHAPPSRRESERKKEDTDLLLKIAEQRAHNDILRKELDFASATERLKVELGKYQQLYADAKEALARMLDDTISKSHDVQKETFRKRIAQLELEIELFKNSNAGKCNAGEFAIATWLVEMFPSYEVIDASRTPNACDLHVKTDEAGMFFAVEVKNKARIASEDIKKFARDVEAMAETHANAFRGAVFVSLRTKNIPTKGTLKFEVYKDRPILYIAIQGDHHQKIEEEKKVLEGCLKMMFQMCSCTQNESKLREAYARIEPMCIRLDKMRRDIERVRDSAKEIVKMTATMHADASEILVAMQSITKESSLHHNP